jgi:hypothetical protein
MHSPHPPSHHQISPPASEAEEQQPLPHFRLDVASSSSPASRASPHGTPGSPDQVRLPAFPLRALLDAARPLSPEQRDDSGEADNEEEAEEDEEEGPGDEDNDPDPDPDGNETEEQPTPDLRAMLRGRKQGSKSFSLPFPPSELDVRDPDPSPFSRPRWSSPDGTATAASAAAAAATGPLFTAITTGKHTTYACTQCGKVYKHASCVHKHRWEHTAHWEETNGFSLTKHQRVLLLEGASILCKLQSAPLAELEARALRAAGEPPGPGRSLAGSSPRTPTHSSSSSSRSPPSSASAFPSRPSMGGGRRRAQSIPGSLAASGALALQPRPRRRRPAAAASPPKDVGAVVAMEMEMEQEQAVSLAPSPPPPPTVGVDPR